MSTHAPPHAQALPPARARLVRGTPGTWATVWACDIQPHLRLAGIDAPLAGPDTPTAAQGPGSPPQPPKPRQILVVESPVTGLAAALQQDPGTDASAWLNAWLHGAQELMRQPRHPRPLWLEWREVQAAPQALPALLGAAPATAQRDAPRAAPGAAPADEPTPGTPATGPDPLCLALARALVDAHPGIGRLMPTLLAQCTPLGTQDDDDADDAAPLQDRAGPTDPTTVLRRWAALAQQAAATPALQQALATAQAERDARATEAAEHARDAADAREEGELLLLQLHQVQEELETQFLQRREAEERVATLQAEADALRQERDQLTAEAQALRAERDHFATETASLRDALHHHQAAATEVALTLGAERDRANAEAATLRDALHHQQAATAEQAQARAQAEEQAAARQAELQAELDAHRTNTQAATEEAELLLLQLHQVQEELEAQFLARRDLADTLAAQPAHTHIDSLLRASAAALSVAHDRDTPPHRELSFRLSGVQVQDRHVAEAAVRLAEHCGHPGLAIFKSTDDAPLLQGWQETGREDDRPYLLLVPDDPGHEARFAALTAQDEALLPVLAQWMEQHLRAHAPELTTRWAHVARRLRALLAERAPALKIDSAAARPLAEADEGAASETGWAFTLHGVRHGARTLPWLRVHWRPADPLRPWALLRDAQAGPPLPAWPDGADGHPPAKLEFAFGPAASEDRRHAPWAALPPADRHFVMALLYRWPDVVRQALPTGPDTEALALDARSLLQEALQAQHPRHAAAGQGPSPLIRRLARRLRQGNTLPNPQAAR